MGTSTKGDLYTYIHVHFFEHEQSENKKNNEMKRGRKTETENKNGNFIALVVLGLKPLRRKEHAYHEPVHFY